MNARLTLKAIQQGQAQKTYALKAGAGQNGQALVIPAAKGTRYQLTDALTFTSPEKLQIKRVGSDLLIALPGNDVDSPDVVIRGYFEFEDMALTGLAPNGQPMVYDASGSLLSSLRTTVPAGITPASLQPDQTLSAGLAKGTQGWFDSGWGLGALAAGGVALAVATKSDGGSAPASSTNAGLAKIAAYNLTPTGPLPTVNDFAQAGVSGVDSSNLNGVLSALTRTQLPMTSATSVQSLVDSFKKVLSEANGSAADATPTSDPSVKDYENLMGANTPSALPRKSAAVELLNDRLKTLSPTEADTYSELKALADVVNSLSELAESTPSSNGTAASGLTADNLKALIGSDVTATNLNAVSDAIRHAPDDLSTLNSMARLSALVKAYNVILAEANGSTEDTTLANPTAADYAAIHAHIGTASTDAAALARLNAVVGQLPSSSVDTIAEINRLALALDKIQALAALETGAALSDAQKLSVDELRSLGLSGFTGTEIQNAALAQQVSEKIRDSAPADVLGGTGTGLTLKNGLKTSFDQTELERLQSLVSGAIITSYQVDPSTNTAKTVAPTVNDWTRIGVFKPTDDGSGKWQSLVEADLPYLNSAADKLGPEALDTRDEAQAVVGAYVRIVQQANGRNTDPVPGINPSADDLARVGVTGAVTTDGSPAFALMLDVISNAGSTAVDSVGELQGLADTVAQITQTGQDRVLSFSETDLSGLGLLGVNASNLNAIKTAVKSSATSGVDSIAELQALVYESYGLKFSELWSGYTFDGASSRGAVAMKLLTDSVVQQGAQAADTADEIKNLAGAVKTLIDLAAVEADAKPQSDPVTNANDAIVYEGTIPANFSSQLALLGFSNASKLDDSKFQANTANVSKEKDNVWASIQDLNVDIGLTYDAIQTIVNKYAI